MTPVIDINVWFWWVRTGTGAGTGERHEFLNIKPLHENASKLFTFLVHFFYCCSSVRASTAATAGAAAAAAISSSAITGRAKSTYNA